MDFVNTSYMINILNTYFLLSPFILLTLAARKKFSSTDCIWRQLFRWTLLELSKKKKRRKEWKNEKIERACIEIFCYFDGLGWTK